MTAAVGSAMLNQLASAANRSVVVSVCRPVNPPALAPMTTAKSLLVKNWVRQLPGMQVYAPGA